MAVVMDNMVAREGRRMGKGRVTRGKDSTLMAAMGVEDMDRCHQDGRSSPGGSTCLELRRRTKLESEYTLGLGRDERIGRNVWSACVLRPVLLSASE